MTPTRADALEALEEFNSFCRFIDGLNMNGFVENDFMSKPVQEKIRAALLQVQELERVREILDTIRKSGFVSYNGEKPYVLACEALVILDKMKGE